MNNSQRVHRGRTVSQAYCAESLESRVLLAETVIRFPMGEPKPPRPLEYTPPQAVTANATAGTVIDVLALYTPMARDVSGSAAAIENVIRTSMADTNRVFANSQIDVAMRLVHTAQVQYTESSDMADDLYALMLKGDGKMDQIHSLRDFYGADVVTLFVGPADLSGTLGIGFVLDSMTNSAWDDESAFTVVMNHPSYTLQDYVFTHELGHNLGSDHDPAHGGGQGIFPFAQGHRFQADGRWYIDIMAYYTAPTDTKIPYFANPGVLYPPGQPNAVATGTATADLKRTFDITAPFVSQYRPTAPERETPTAVVKSAPPLNLARTGPYLIQIEYLDNDAINVATIGNGDLRVVGPGGAVLNPVFDSVNNGSNGTPRLATYRVDSPDGKWDISDSGVYAIEVQAQQVGDINGNFVTPGKIGEFVVEIGGPSARLIVQNMRVPAATHPVAVEYTDNNFVDWQSIGDGDIRVTGPAGEVLVVFDGVDVPANGIKRTGAYHIAKPGGALFNSLDNGVYTVSLQANQVRDAGNPPDYSAPRVLGTFMARLPIPQEVTVSINGIDLLNPLAGPVQMPPSVYGLTGSTLRVKVRNDGDAPLSLSNLSVTPGFLVWEGLAPTLAAMPEDGDPFYDTFDIRVVTDVVGTRSGTITFQTNDPDEQLYSIPIEAVVAGGPEISVTNNSGTNQDLALAVPATPVGMVGDPEPFLIQNSGDYPLFVRGISRGGMDYTDFRLLILTDDNRAIHTNEFTVPPGRVYQMQVRLAPQQIGQKSAMVSFETNDYGDGEDFMQLSMSGLAVPPQISIADATVSEGAGSTQVKVSVAGKSLSPVTVRYSTANLEAQAGKDYTGVTGGLLTIPAGETFAYIHIPILQDAIDEPAERFRVILIDPSGATLKDAEALVTIADDDLPTVTIKPNPLSATEGNAGSPKATFTATLSAVADTPVVITYTTVDGTARAKVDYVAAPGKTVTIPAGQLKAAFSIALVPDTVYEPDETFVVRCKGSGATVIAASREIAVTIRNDDVPMTVKFNPLALPRLNAVTYAFQVVYSSRQPINTARLDSRDILVVNSKNAKFPVVYKGVTLSTDKKTATATYVMNGPGGRWDAADVGTYKVMLQANQVSDTAGSFAVGGVIGSFSIQFAATRSQRTAAADEPVASCPPAAITGRRPFAILEPIVDSDGILD